MIEPTLLDRLLVVADLFARDMARAFEGTALTTARMTLLWSLHHSGPVAQHTLAEALDVSPRNITALVDALEAAGYVVRRAHPTDRRARLVELTAAGARLMDRTAQEHAELSETLLAAVAPRDREALERGLDAVAVRLHELIAEHAAAEAAARSAS